MSPSFDVVELATTYANKSAQDILKLAFAEFGVPAAIDGSKHWAPYDRATRNTLLIDATDRLVADYVRRLDGALAATAHLAEALGYRPAMPCA